jgi:membrane protein
MAELVQKIKTFLLEGMWRIRRDETSKRQYWLIRALRIFFLAVRRFVTDNGTQKATALTFYSFLSVVPVVAMAFGIAKGFGFREALEVEIQQQLVGHEEVIQWIEEFALRYLDNTKGGMIAGIGFGILLYAVMQVLISIEAAFNDIWNVKKARSFVRMFSDYLSIVLVAIILLVTSSSIVLFIANRIEDLGIGKIGSSFVIWVAPYIMVWTVFSLVLMIMPNTKVKPLAAIFGGVVAGTLFLLVQYLYIYFQVGVSRYNAIYGSFAALPLFLILMRTSWVIIIFGAELSFAFQNERSFEFEVETKTMSLHTRKLVALVLVSEVVKTFSRGEMAQSALELSSGLRLPIRLVNEVVTQLMDAGILVEINVAGNREMVLQPAFDIQKMDIAGVLSRIEHSGYSGLIPDDIDSVSVIRESLSELEDRFKEMPSNRLLMDI